MPGDIAPWKPTEWEQHIQQVLKLRYALPVGSYQHIPADIKGDCGLEGFAMDGTASLKRLHILNWALRSPKNRAEFEQVMEHQQPLFSFQFRFEPALGRAIHLAVGEKLVEWVGGDRLKITAKGKGWITDILKDASVMHDEREFLERIGKTITEPLATEMITVKTI